MAKILYEYKQLNSIVVYVPMFREAKEDIFGNEELYTEQVLPNYEWRAETFSNNEGEK